MHFNVKVKVLLIFKHAFLHFFRCFRFLESIIRLSTSFIDLSIVRLLLQIPHWTVLLLEAGPDENEISDVPSLAAYLQLTELDWQYKTEPTGRACLGMKVFSKHGDALFQKLKACLNGDWTQKNRLKARLSEIKR